MVIHLANCKMEVARNVIQPHESTANTVLVSLDMVASGLRRR